MNSKTPKLLGCVAAAILLAWITYLCSQGPKVSTDPEQFGLMLFRGGYRAWYLSFCDGRRGDGKPVYFDLQQNRWQVGYRWPAFYHTDIRKYVVPGINEVHTLRDGVFKPTLPGWPEPGAVIVLSNCVTSNLWSTNFVWSKERR